MIQAVPDESVTPAPYAWPIRADGLTVRAGRRFALAGVDLALGPGVHGVLGPNGAGESTPLRALAAFPAAVLVGFAFGGLGMALSTLMRSWQDFDLMGSAQFALFLFSGTFVPPQAYPAALRWLVEISPLYQSVLLVRGISVGSVGWPQVGAVAYLLLATALGLALAARRMTKLLCK